MGIIFYQRKNKKWCIPKLKLKKKARRLSLARYRSTEATQEIESGESDELPGSEATPPSVCHLFHLLMS